MLSVENPPPDPSCSYKFPLLNSDSDERASAFDHKLAAAAAEEVDLPNSDLHHTPLPNFSMRDYVFTARTKDIKKNWPFSLKNLQLCLKHGVKELLPPLKPLDKVSKKSLETCMVETSLAEKEKTGNHAAVDSNSDDPQLNVKLVESCLDISSCRSGDENDFPSTTTSVSHSEIESLNVNRLSTSQTETYQGTSAAVESAGPSGNNNKSENTFRPLSKKCRLIVKFGSSSDRSSTEDIASNSTTLSEIMASKVCPVCKTFSSSSNTTLNAHIDQCLVVESSPKWTSDSKITRQRIKPRKTRLMVDIYTTALPCTLEELDRRNGTSWATVSCLPTQEIEKAGNAETINGRKMMRVSHIHPEDIGDVGAVYIDANGTKLRILSKLDEQPSVRKLGEDIDASKPQKGDKGGKYISKKKKKRLAKKHDKFLKLAPKNKMNFSQKAHGSQEGECQGEAKSCEKELMVSKQTKPSDSVTLRPWVCSKRRGFTKKTSQEGQQPVNCNWNLPQDSLAYNGQSFSGETLMERNVVQKFANLSENPISSSAKNDRMEKSFRKVHVTEKREQSPGRKRMGDLMLSERPSDNLGHSPVKLSVHSGNCGTSVKDTYMTRPSNSMFNHSSLLKKRTFDAFEAANTSDISCIASSKSSQDAIAIPSRGMEFPLRKNILRVNGRSSVTKYVHGKFKKLSALQKSRLCFTKKRNREGVSEKDQECDLMLGNPKNQEEREDESFEVNTALEPKQGRGILCVSQGDGEFAKRNEKPLPHFYDHDHDVLVTANSSVGAGDDFLRRVDCLDSAGNQVCVYVEDIVVQPSSNTSDERSAACTINSMDSEFYELSNSLHPQPDSLQSAEDYRSLLCGNEAPAAPTEPHFFNDRDMFSTDEVVAGQDSHITAELDSEAGHGHSFPEADPILIPGPPGSFLPSPRDMGAEDFQGNSSRTTGRVHSSLDQHDPVDGESSDSPMSAASTISTSTADRCNFKYLEPSSSVRPYNRMRSTAASVESSLQSFDAVPQASGAEVERTAFDGGYLKLDRIYVEKGSLSFKNDQPCCCQRKERLSQAVALNFQESQLLRRRKMASMTIPTCGKQIDFNSNLRSANLDVRSEFVPPSSCPNQGSEKMVLPDKKPLSGTISFKNSPYPVGVNFSARADSDSPSASNPVLRLMGKNLLVVNKDDDTSVPAVQPYIQNSSPISQFLAFSEVSPGNNIHNHDSLIRSQASVIFGQSLNNPASQFNDGVLSNSFRLPINAQPSAGVFEDQHTDCFFATSTEYHKPKADYNISSGHIMFKNRPNADNMGTLECRFQHVNSLQNHVKEMVIIDDVSDSENIMIDSAAKFAEGGRESQVVVSSGIPIQTASKYNTNRVHPFSCYHSPDHPLVVESAMGRTANYHATPSKLCNQCPVMWGCTSEGSGVHQLSPFTAASSSPGLVRCKTLHYSPGFS